MEAIRTVIGRLRREQSMNVDRHWTQHDIRRIVADTQRICDELERYIRHEQAAASGYGATSGIPGDRIVATTAVRAAPLAPLGPRMTNGDPISAITPRKDGK